MPSASSEAAHAGGAYSLTRIKLTDFRNYAALDLVLDGRPVALFGENGSGKTNLLEAVSLLVPGRGLRGVAFETIAREDGRGGWTVFATIEGPHGTADVGTGYVPPAGAETPRSRREVRIDGVPATSVNALAGICRMVWLTPAMDGLFTGSAGERRRFMDRLVLAVDPEHRARVNAYETAMRQRNALLAEGSGDARWLDALEVQMAEHGAALAAARRDCIGLLQGVLARRSGAGGAFPDMGLALEGTLERDLAEMAAVDAEDAFRQRLAAARQQDRAAGRTLDGPHRADLIATHGAKGRAAQHCSTGEQKIMLVGIVLAHARLVRELTGGATPLILLDEVAAHLDAAHRAALMAEIRELGAQAWMTGTDRRVLDGDANGVDYQIFTVRDGTLTGAGAA